MFYSSPRRIIFRLKTPNSSPVWKSFHPLNLKLKSSSIQSETHRGLMFEQQFIEWVFNLLAIVTLTRLCPHTLSIDSGLNGQELVITMLGDMVHFLSKDLNFSKFEIHSEKSCPLFGHSCGMLCVIWDGHSNTTCFGLMDASPKESDSWKWVFLRGKSIKLKNNNWFLGKEYWHVSINRKDVLYIA